MQIAGSASLRAPRDLLVLAHQFVRAVALDVLRSGGGFVTGAGDEPIGEEGVPLTFDWDVLEAIADATDPAPNWPGNRPGRFRIVASQRALNKVPENRREVWGKCLARTDIELSTSEPGWRMGGIIRAKQVQHGDLLVTLGGGAGTEHLAHIYSDDGKSVIPIHCEIGAISGDGMGGSSGLHNRALHDVESFFSLVDGKGGAAARLSPLRLTLDTDVGGLSRGVIDLITDLRNPLAFYIRLLDSSSSLHPEVEDFFRNVVDPVVASKGFARYEVGLDAQEEAFLNVEIFQRIHRAGLVVADITDVRPNCLMELGYALARRRSTVITAKAGTRLPFDQDKLSTFFWNPSGDARDRVAEFEVWTERHIDLPALIE